MSSSVSIVMITWSPTPKRLKVLKASLDSMREHTKMPHTLVVVDNGPAEQTEYLKTQNIDILLTQETNIGIGAARNLGAAATNSDYIAFVDSDIAYFHKWLKNGINALIKFYNWPVIVTPIFSSPMKHDKYHIGSIGPYQLYSRSSPQCWIMRRRDYNKIGKWVEHSKPGSNYCDRVRFHRYFFMWLPTWTARHICKRASYNHKCILDKDGVWKSREQLMESTA